MFDSSTPLVDLVTGDSVAPGTLGCRDENCCNRRHALTESGSAPDGSTDGLAGRPIVAKLLDGFDVALTDHPAADDLGALVGHLVDFHHTFLRRELPRLNALLTGMVAAHSDLHPELHGIAATLAALTEELMPHIEWEEQQLFPLARRDVDRDAIAGLDDRRARDVVKVVHAEHDRISELLTMLRAQTCGFTPPPGACLTWRALYAGLADFAVSTHQHVHLEDTALFPRLLELDGGFALSS